MHEHPEVYRLRREFERHRRVVQERAGHDFSAEREQDDRLDVLEFNIARLLLMIQSVVELANRKNLFSTAELAEIEAELDRLAGPPEAGSTPAATPGMRTASRGTSLFGFLRRLEAAQEPMTPKEFFESLDEPKSGNRPPNAGS